jgi:hypothetical protein
VKPILLMILLWALPGFAQGQHKAPAAAPCKPGLQMVNGNLVAVNCSKQITPIVDAVAPNESGIGRLSASQQAALDAENNYLAFSWKYRQKVFEWQYRSTIGIFIVSILLVLSGIAFAAWQLQYSMRLGLHRMSLMTAAAAASAASGSTDPASPDSNDTTLKVSPTGLEVHSATLGVIILAFSMCFFYMYLKYVYPIQIVPTHAPEPAGSAPNTQSNSH